MQHNSCAHFEHFALTIPNTSHPCLYHLRVVFFVPSSTTTIMQGFSLVSACFGCVLHVPHAYLGPFCCCLAAELEFIDMDTPNIFQQYNVSQEEIHISKPDRFIFFLRTHTLISMATNTLVFYISNQIKQSQIFVKILLTKLTVPHILNELVPEGFKTKAFDKKTTAMQ